MIMEISKRVSNVIDRESAKLSDDKKLKEYMEYYKELREAGIARKEEYTIPLIKTIGDISLKFK
jgi:hypothetical protein